MYLESEFMGETCNYFIMCQNGYCLPLFSGRGPLKRRGLINEILFLR